MRHELDDEGRREFFEEQEEDAESVSRAGYERCVICSTEHNVWIPSYRERKIATPDFVDRALVLLCATSSPGQRLVRNSST